MQRLIFLALIILILPLNTVLANPAYIPSKKVELRSKDIYSVHKKLGLIVDWMQKNKQEILKVMSNNNVSVKQRLNLRKKQNRYMQKIGVKKPILFWSKVIAIKNAVMFKEVNNSGLNEQMKKLYASQKQMVIGDTSLNAAEKKSRLKDIERAEASLSYLQNPKVPQQNLRMVKKYPKKVQEIIELTKKLNPSMMN